MTLGTSIFLSAVILSVVILFTMTKDRWNWKRIARWAVFFSLGLVVIVLLTVAGRHLYSMIEERPKPQTEFFGIPLQATVADVKFAAGEPTIKEGEDYWIYQKMSYFSKKIAAEYLVDFENGRVWFILYRSYKDNNYGTVHPRLLGFTFGSSYQEVIKKLGKPSSISNSSDDLEKTYSYDKLNVFFAFRQSAVYAYGIFNPQEGTLKYRSENPTPSNTK
jgi:hypothetical protein